MTPSTIAARLSAAHSQPDAVASGLESNIDGRCVMPVALATSART